MSRRKKKLRGHYCWSCQRILPNERFSGRGHAKHVCKKCSALGSEELKVRSGIRNIDRLLGWSGRISRKDRSAFEKFLNHKNERIRQYAEGIKASLELERQRFLDAVRADEESLDDAIEAGLRNKQVEPDTDSLILFEDDDEIPF